MIGLKPDEIQLMTISELMVYQRGWYQNQEFVLHNTRMVMWAARVGPHSKVQRGFQPKDCIKLSSDVLSKIEPVSKTEFLRVTNKMKARLLASKN